MKPGISLIISIFLFSSCNELHPGELTGETYHVTLYSKYSNQDEGILPFYYGTEIQKWTFRKNAIAIEDSKGKNLIFYKINDEGEFELSDELLGVNEITIEKDHDELTVSGLHVGYSHLHHILLKLSKDTASDKIVKYMLHDSDTSLIHDFGRQFKGTKEWSDYMNLLESD